MYSSYYYYYVLVIVVVIGRGWESRVVIDFVIYFWVFVSFLVIGFLVLL